MWYEPQVLQVIWLSLGSSLSVSVSVENLSGTTLSFKSMQVANTMRSECWDMCVLGTDFDLEENVLSTKQKELAGLSFLSMNRMCESLACLAVKRA